MRRARLISAVFPLASIAPATRIHGSAPSEWALPLKNEQAGPLYFAAHCCLQMRDPPYRARSAVFLISPHRRDVAATRPTRERARSMRRPAMKAWMKAVLGVALATTLVASGAAVASDPMAGDSMARDSMAGNSRMFVPARPDPDSPRPSAGSTTEPVAPAAMPPAFSNGRSTRATRSSSYRTNTSGATPPMRWVIRSTTWSCTIRRNRMAA